MIPRPLYEALPYLYTSAGLAAALKLDTPLGRLSGGLLFLAGLAVWAMRRHYRSEWQ